MLFTIRGYLIWNLILILLLPYKARTHLTHPSKHFMGPITFIKQYICKYVCLCLKISLTAWPIGFLFLRFYEILLVCNIYKLDCSLSCCHWINMSALKITKFIGLRCFMMHNFWKGLVQNAWAVQPRLSPKFNHQLP